MPTQSIMPYPLVGTDTNGHPAVLGPAEKTLHRWIIQTPQLPLDCAWTLLSKTQLESILDTIAESTLTAPHTDTPPAPVQATMNWLCPDPARAHTLLNAVSYISEKRNATPAALTRKFKALERILNNPATPEWFWIKIDKLP